jgi:high-affinity iron transporter
MFGTGLIVFRETLEAALFVGIVAAATRSVPNRTRWLMLGAVAGMVGSLLMATAIEQISDWANGLGQDLVNVVILSVALLMLTWHTIWVSTHAREMTEDARRLGADASQGVGSLWAVALAVAMTVLREGAETVLFVAGLASGSPEGIATLMLSATLGFLLGVAAGWLIYSGLGQVQPRRLFAITNVLILMLAGNLASQLARTMQQADWLQWLSERAWDSSALLTNDSLIGMVLHGVIGYDASPSQLQVLFYLLSILLISSAARHMRLRSTVA